MSMHLLTYLNLNGIGNKLLIVQKVNVAKGTLLLDMDRRKPLKFTRKIRSKDGEIPLRLKYERLFKHCSNCGFITYV